MVDHDDEAIARLRASDPATGSDPDLHSLRSLIAAKAPASQGTDHVTAVTDDVLRGPRVHAPWIAAAAVAAFGMGGGGYALGAHTAEPPPVAGQPGAGDDAQGEEDAARPGADMTGADGASVTSAAGWGSDEAMGGSGPAYDMGPVRLVAGPELPTERGTAEVRALVSDVDPEEFLTRWAEELGVDGVRPEPSADSEGWYGESVLVEPESMLILSVSTQGAGAMHFSYDDQLNSPYCKDMWVGASPEDLEMMREDWTKAMGPDIPVPDPALCKELSGPAPSEEQAVAAAEDFLATTGLDLSGYSFEASDYQEPGNPSVSVEGWPEDGVRSGELSMNLTVSAAGVVNAWGTVGEMTSLGDYPVISAAEAVERYSQREFSMDYGVSLAEDMVPYEGDMTSMPEVTMPETVPIEPGMKIPLLLKDKVVTSAELTTGTIWTQTGGSFEVPAWKLITDDGLHYAVLAVADEAIDWLSWE